MRLPLFQVDAFTSRVFGGNPAAVCPLDAWLPDADMQAIALENNLSETAFSSRPPSPCPVPAGLVEALGAAPRETLASGDLVAVFGSEEQVRALRPDMARQAALYLEGFITW